ncbi:MAG: SPOR domain-containing protein [Gemmatimonadaceae bacterium]
MPPDHEQGKSWEDQGRLLSSTLEGCHSAVLVGENPEAAARVALGIGRAQARRRRVAIGDVVGELDTIQQLVPADFPHGLVDSFLYGVSLNRIAHPIDPAKNLFVMPSGAGPMDHTSILRSARWPKLTAGFVEVDALLLVIAPAGVAGLDTLIAATDGAIVVGEPTAVVPGKILARLTRDGALVGSTSVSVAPAPTVAADSPELEDGVAIDESRRESQPVVGAAPALERRQFPRHGATTVVGDEMLAAAFGHQRSASRAGLVIGLLIAAVALFALAFWVLRARGNVPGKAPASGLTGSVAPSAPPDTSPTDGGDLSVAARVAGGVMNAADSSSSSAYSVELALFSSLADANAQIEQEQARGLMAVTFAPVIFPDNARWYRVVTGAERESASADSLLRRLRSRKILSAGNGTVVRAPFALLVQRDVEGETASALVQGYRLKGLPVYALLQNDGNASLYAGAFESVEQASLLLSTFAAAGERPPVVYRTGRPF